MAFGTPAALALTMEGLEVTEIVMNDRHHYGRMFTEQWQTGRGFVLVEHDIVPWPGAVEALADCPEELCAYRYPTGGDAWGLSLGCTKFADTLVQRVPYDVTWQNRGWDELDGGIFATLQDMATMHVHEPPVAHAKARALTMRQVPQ